MANQEPTSDRPSFQPRPERSDLLSVHLLWRIADKVVVCDNGCWEWRGALTASGYGSIRQPSPTGGTVQYIHRIVAEICVGPIVPGMQVLHRCDNPPCCNPTHLVIGTQQDNVDDMDRKGRRVAVGPKGSAAFGSKLTDEKVAEIRRRLARGEPTSQRMADELDIHFATLRRIARGETWRHVQ